MRITTSSLDSTPTKAWVPVKTRRRRPQRDLDHTTAVLRSHRGRVERERARARLRALRDCGEAVIARYQRYHPVEFARDLALCGFKPVSGAQAGAPAGTAPAVVAALPFTSGSHEHVEPAFTFTATPGGTITRTNPIDIPAAGYITSVFLECVFTGGVAGTLAADGPWNALTDVTFMDVNGSTIVSPMDGYSLMVANLFGGFSGVRNNPADSPWFVNSAPNPAFYLRVPVEISHKDALGALINQNTSANLKLTFGVNTSGNIFSVAPTTIPLLTVRGWLEAWTLPASQDSRGNPQSQVPPLLGTGQYHSIQGPRATIAGSYSVPLTRLGNYLRYVGIISRDGAGVRTDASFPDPVQFNWDNVQLWSASQRYMQQKMYEHLNGVFTRPVGVWCLPFNFGGEYPAMGNETPDLWLPTTQSGRYSFDGTAAAAGSTTLITCEVAPVEVDQSQRYVQQNMSTWNENANGQVPAGAGAAR